MTSIVSTENPRKGTSVLPCIAVDGPAGSGKTSTGRTLAARLGYRFLDTGQMYRAVTLAALRAGAPPDDAKTLADLAARITIEVENGEDGRPHILIDGEEVTALLSDPEVDRNVSAVSAVAGVRAVLVQQQRRIAEQGGIVMTGRDIGTVVLPDSQLKVYLTASPETRARRRYAEMTQRGATADYADILRRMGERDRLDSTRAASPLRPAPDAVVIETDDMTFEQVVDRLHALAREARLPDGPAGSGNGSRAHPAARGHSAGPGHS